MDGGSRKLLNIVAGVTLLFQLAAIALGNTSLAVYRTPDLIDFSFRYDPALWHVHEERVFEYGRLIIELQNRTYSYSLQFHIRRLIESGFGNFEPDQLPYDAIAFIHPFVRVPYRLEEDTSFAYLHKDVLGFQNDTVTIWDYWIPIEIEASTALIDELYANFTFYSVGFEHPPRVWLNIVTNAPEALIGEVDSIIASLTFRRCTSYDEPCESSK